MMALCGSLEKFAIMSLSETLIAKMKINELNFTLARSNTRYKFSGEKKVINPTVLSPVLIFKK